MTSNKCATYDFTASAEDYPTHYDILNVLNNKELGIIRYCFQKEKGEETGYIHYNGRFHTDDTHRVRPGTMIKRLQAMGCKFRNVQPTSNANKDNNFYVTKEDTRIEGPWTDKDCAKYIPRQIREITSLYSWQGEVIDNAKKWDTRTINILVDKNGNNGKSILKTYIGVHKIGRSIPFTNDYRDMMRMVMDTEKMPLYIIDIPRALRKDQLFQFFSGIETLKDGYAYDDRYHFREEYFDCPNIWVFMNQVPDTEYLSKDRWVFWTIDPNTKSLVKNGASL